MIGFFHQPVEKGGKMGQGNGVLRWVIVVAAAVVLGLSGGGWVKANAAEKVFDCAPQGNIQKEISTNAQLEEFSCFFKKWEGINTLHFKVAVKNISDKPQRYRVNIFLDNGKAVGGLIPRKTKKGLLKPGTTASFVYPVGRTTSKPASITLLIKSMD